MATATSSQMQLTGSNRLWIELIYDQSISGITNTISVTMRVRTRWWITGTWQCQLIVDNQSTGVHLCRIEHGSVSVENQGYSDVLHKTITTSYTGSRAINLTAIIYNMDYQDIITGAYGVFNPTFSTTIGLNYITPPNSSPSVPNIYVKNPVYNNKYIVENTLSVELSQVNDPNGDKVVYIVQCEKKEPGSNKWTSAGDSYSNVLYSAEKRDVTVITNQYSRGTQFRVRGQARDISGATKGYTGWIENIYKNYAPNNVNNIYPLKANIFTNTIKLSWDNANDYENMPLTYTVMVSKNKDSFSVIADKIAATNINYDISQDDYETTYTFKVITNDVYTSSNGKTSVKYIKTANKPTTPTNIAPSSGYYLKNVVLTWNKSIVPDETEIKKYIVMINGEMVGTTPNNRFNFIIPDMDEDNTAYRISVKAISNNDIESDIGYANGNFYKASKPKPPAYINPNNIYHERTIKLNWEKVISNDIQCNYELSVNINNTKWVIINANLNTASYNFDLSKYNFDDNIQFRIRSINSFNLYSNYAYSLNYIKNKLPNIPILQYPLNDSVIYNNSPRICITIPSKNNNQKLILFVEVDNKVYRSDKDLDFFSNKNKSFDDTTNIIFKPNNITSKTKFSMYLYDGESYSKKTNFNYTVSNIDANKIINLSNGYIAASIFTIVRGHITNLNTAYNNSSKITKAINKNDFIYFSIIEEFRDNINMINEKINNFDILNNNFDRNISWIEASTNSFISKKILIEIIENLKLI